MLLACMLAGAVPAWATTLPWLPQVLKDPFATEKKASGSIAPALKPADCPPLPDMKAPLHFGEVVIAVLCHDPDTRAAYLTLLGQADSYGTSYAAYFPTLSGSEGFSHNTSFYRHTVTSSNGTSAGLSAGVTLYDFGRREATVDAAEQTLIAAGHTYNSTLQGAIAQALDGYYKLLTSQNALNAAKESLHYVKESYDAADLRHQIGQVPLADALQAKGTLSQSKLSLQQAVNQFYLDQAALATLMGLPPDAAPFVAEVDDSTLTTDPFGGKVQSLMELAKQQRYDLAASRSQLESAKASLRVTERADLPSLSASADVSGPHTNLFNGTNARTQAFGVSVSIPIFTGFSQTYSERAARRQLEAQTATLERTELSVQQDVWTAWHNYQTARQSWETSWDLTASATQLKDVALGRYREGLGTILDVLNAQSQYSSALQTQLQSRYNLFTTRVDLVRAVGVLNLNTMQPDAVMDKNAASSPEAK